MSYEHSRNEHRIFHNKRKQPFEERKLSQTSVHQESHELKSMNIYISKTKAIEKQVAGASFGGPLMSLKIHAGCKIV